MAVLCMCNENYAMRCLLIDEWPKFPCPVAFLLTTVLIVTFNCGLGYGADATFHRTYF